MSKELRLGIALGGGAALGAVHVGVLKALDEAEIRIDCLTGTSIGAFVAALYAFETPVARIEEIMLNLNWLNVTGLKPSALGLFSNQKLGDVLEETLGSVTFADAPRPLALVATDISTGEKIVLNSGEVKQAVMASCAIPGIFVPIERDDRLLVDGGLVENVPLETLRNMGVAKTIGVDLAAKTALAEPTSVIDLVINMTWILLDQARKNQLEKADYSITPDTTSHSLVNTNNLDELVQIGYEATTPLVDELCEWLASN